MKDDVLERLKKKEEEMEALIEEARKRAASIREEALRKAKDLRESRIREMEEELKALAGREERLIVEEASRIEEEGGRAAGELKRKAAVRREGAVKEVLRALLEGIGDKGDEKGPDNRA